MSRRPARRYDDSWFHDPTGLRERAALYDEEAERAINPQFASAWRGKASAVRSRATKIEEMRNG